MLADLFCQLHGDQGHERLKAAVDKLAETVRRRDAVLPPTPPALMAIDLDPTGSTPRPQKKSDLLLAQGWGMSGTQFHGGER